MTPLVKRLGFESSLALEPMVLSTSLHCIVYTCDSYYIWLNFYTHRCIVKDREACIAAVHRVVKSWTLTEQLNNP